MNKLIVLIIISFLFSNNRIIFLFSQYFQLYRGKKYINNCLKTTNFNLNSNLKKFIPKISIIIPVFNCEKSIKFSLASIQNQKLKEIEIILVNDFSQDNSKYIIEYMQKEDPRIIIINNHKNLGTLYSRNIGAIYANGNFIFCLDNDDMFFYDNILFKLYNIAMKNNYDIIGFKAIKANNYKSKIFDMIEDPFIINKKEKEVYQPNLKYLSITNNDCHIWGKCIKNEIYKKAISLLGIKRSSTYLCNAEDDVIVLTLFNVSKNFRFIPIYGIFHLISNLTASNTLPKSHLLFSKLFFVDLLFDLSGNNYNEKKYVIDNICIIKNYILSKNITFNRKNKKYLKHILHKINSCPHIPQRNKTNINHMFKK